MELAFLAAEDLGLGPFLQVDAKGFCCVGSVPQPIDSFDRGPSALDKDAGGLPCPPRYLLRAPLLRHPGPPGRVLGDVFLEWFFSSFADC